MQRAVEHDEVELRGHKRQRVEVGLDGRESNRIVAARAKTISRIVQAIDGDRMMPSFGEAM